MPLLARTKSKCGFPMYVEPQRPGSSAGVPGTRAGADERRDDGVDELPLDRRRAAGIYPLSESDRYEVRSTLILVARVSFRRSTLRARRAWRYHFTYQVQHDAEAAYRCRQGLLAARTPQRRKS